jgi:KAP family P-loop domain
MRLFPQDNNVVLYQTGFEDDILNRKAISNQLSELVDKIDDPIVIALDDKWGSGKTYFLKRWVAAHQRDNGGKAITVYFDAFENDYLSDPLVSIVSAISERMPTKHRSLLKNWRSAASKLAKPAFGIALSLATFGATQHLDEIGDVVAEAAGSEIEKTAEGLWEKERERKDALRLFRKSLAEMTKDDSASIVIVVDELDRCRPDYALSVLEVIKHFFSVSGVHFILGISSEALQNSVQARYGANIDAERYLRKFINVSFSLPRMLGSMSSESSLARYASHLISDMGLPKKISERCANFLSVVSRHNEVSLRDVGKIFSRIALLPKAVTEKDYMEGWIETLCILLVTSVVEPRLHKKLILASATSAELKKFLGATKEKTSERIGDQYNSDYDHNLTVWLASAIFVCSSDSVEDDLDLPEWRRQVGSHFDRFGTPREHKKIPSTIQKEWLDVFRV